MITLNRKEFNSKLTKIQGLMSKGNITSSALFEVKNGDSCIKATDMVTGLKQKINLSSDKSAEFCVDKKICEIVKEIEGESITLALTDEDKHLLLTAGKGRFRIPCYPRDKFNWWPDIEEAGEERITINANDMTDCLKKAILFVTPNWHDIKNCVLLEITADNIRFVSTDSYRLALIDKKSATGVAEDRKYLIPESAASEIINFLLNAKEAVIVLSEKRLSFEANGDELIIRPLEYTSYPMYTKALNDDGYATHSKMFADKAVLTKVLRRVSVIDTQKKVVRFTIKDSLLSISSSSEMGEASDEMEVLYNSPDGDEEEFEIGLNAEYILDALKAASTDDPVFNFSRHNKPVYIEGGEGELYVVMPMIITKSKKQEEKQQEEKKWRD